MICNTHIDLVPFSNEHLTPQYIDWLNDQSLMHFSEQRHRKHSKDTCETYLKSFESSPHLFLAILERKSGTHIGNINAYIDINNKVADIGILVGNKQFSGKGFGLEAWCALISYLFEKRDIRKITAGTMSLNQPMLKIMSKSGMIIEGYKKRQYLLEGQEVDLVQMAIFKEDYIKISVANNHFRHVAIK